MKQRSGFRDVEAAAVCGLGYQRKGNCRVKEPQKSEKSAIEPLVRDEVSHTPRRGKYLSWDCELNGNCTSCQMLGSIGIQTSQCKENLVNILNV